MGCDEQYDQHMPSRASLKHPEWKGVELPLCWICGCGYMPTTEYIDLVTGLRKNAHDSHLSCIAALKHSFKNVVTERDALRGEVDTLLTEENIKAAQAFFNYGATRGNHADAGGRGNGPLSGHVEKMGRVVTWLGSAYTGRLTGRV